MESAVPVVSVFARQHWASRIIGKWRWNTKKTCPKAGKIDITRIGFALFSRRGLAHHRHNKDSDFGEELLIFEQRFGWVCKTRYELFRFLALQLSAKWRKAKDAMRGEAPTWLLECWGNQISP
ncbi:MAG: hypothetical protein CVV06_06620 [Gammaproteobacteria bacterium HGW-Gammaproteobacteria-10]|nr:MAG: hypothetical protein CVV06_06620 [Gammaproteobacteria bacterium HGW-Gammaproteobacteria-10]